MNICVRDSHQARGIGASLVEQLIKRAERERAKRISLSVHKDNIRAISLYRRSGFEVDSFAMALELHGKEHTTSGKTFQSSQHEGVP
jgi:ribosomal protein S18 acetylase RimI-like enzyme